jgi:pimeloyl-ACP methyl ester carboxylesterase
MKKSTIVHAVVRNTLVGFYRARLRAEALVDADGAADLALRLFSSPQRHRRPDRERLALAKAERHPYLIDGRPHAAWSFGDGPAVLLLHGWEGRGAQLFAFVEPLVARGFRVVAIDAPAHGSSPGSLSTAYELAAALHAVARTVPRVHAVVAHSLGGLASAIAVDEGLEIERLVVIGAPFSPEAALETLTRILALPKGVRDRVAEKIALRSRFTWDELTDGEVWRALPIPLCVVHDSDDKAVPLVDAHAIANLSGGALIETRGLGHHRVLRDPEVVSRVVDFIDDAAVDKRIDPWQRFMFGSFSIEGRAGVS